MGVTPQGPGVAQVSALAWCPCTDFPCIFPLVPSQNLQGAEEKCAEECAGRGGAGWKQQSCGGLWPTLCPQSLFPPSSPPVRQTLHSPMMERKQAQRREGRAPERLSDKGGEGTTED